MYGRMNDRNKIRAVEYVVGTLTGAPRRFFAWRMKRSVELQLEVQLWERRLSGLNASSPAVTPSAAVLPAIMREISQAGESSAGKPLAWAPAFATFLVMLAIGIAAFDMKPTGFQYDLVTELAATDESGESRWKVEVNTDKSQVHIVRLSEYASDINRDYELWMIPKDGSNPVSLGVLIPNAVGSIYSYAGDQIDLTQAAALAVSYEQLGGSPSALPEGPVVFVGSLTPA
jgi:anti-sigma-K factor RskA